MYLKGVLSVIFALTILSGCSSVSSSSVPHVPVNQQTSGPVYLTTQSIPADVGYTVVGHVKANARQGYSKAETLYPMIVEEARKIGANAVMDVRGGRTVSAFSWAAPYVGGTAIRIDDTKKLEDFGGHYY